MPTGSVLFFAGALPGAKIINNVRRKLSVLLLCLRSLQRLSSHLLSAGSYMEVDGRKPHTMPVTEAGSIKRPRGRMASPMRPVIANGHRPDGPRMFRNMRAAGGSN